MRGDGTMRGCLHHDGDDDDYNHDHDHDDDANDDNNVGTGKQCDGPRGNRIEDT